MVLDLVSTIIVESKEKLTYAQEALNEKQWSDSIYHSYTSLINSAKALLVADGVKTNTQAGIVEQFDSQFIGTNTIKLETTFSALVYQIKEYKPTEEFALKYLSDAKSILEKIEEYRFKAEIINY